MGRFKRIISMRLPLLFFPQLNLLYLKARLVCKKDKIKKRKQEVCVDKRNAKYKTENLSGKKSLGV
jgi:hypothetical protein